MFPEADSGSAATLGVWRKRRSVFAVDRTSAATTQQRQLRDEACRRSTKAVIPLRLHPTRVFHQPTRERECPKKAGATPASFINRSGTVGFASHQPSQYGEKQDLKQGDWWVDRRVARTRGRRGGFAFSRLSVNTSVSRPKNRHHKRYSITRTPPP